MVYNTVIVKQTTLKAYLFSIVAILMALPSGMAFADKDDKLEFAAGLEETLGHLHALEMNLEDGDAENALIHATHPIAELYDLLKPTLADHDQALDSQMYSMMLNLRESTSTDVSHSQAQAAINEARELVETARDEIVGEYLSNDAGFQMELMRLLLETSVVEYYEAVSDGTINNMPEFQDGSAFVWRSEQIFEEVRPEIDSDKASAIQADFEKIWNIYNTRADPSQSETAVNSLIRNLESTQHLAAKDTALLEYVDTINDLLLDAKSAYRQGNTDLALSLVTRAYLDNYEFLEPPLVAAGERELMQNVEHMMREELREMIRSGESVSTVDAQIDLILEQMEVVAVIVPEFGIIAVVILAAALVGVVVTTTRSPIFTRI